jgi:PleD family two-component response regulator
MLQWTSASERRFTRLGALNDARVLVANPYHGARRAVRAVLEPLGCVVIEAERPAEVLEAARRRRPHVVLLDAAMEREAGSSMVAEIKSDPELFAIAIVLVGAHGDAAGALAAMERGAHDVLPDDADAFELAARVRAARRGSDMQELLLTRERELERLAYYDELTGLPNRRSVLRQLEALISRGRRHRHDLALLMVDADHFKAVNDRHATPPATPHCARWPTACASACARRTSPGASAGRSSSSGCPTPTPKAPRRWARPCARRWPRAR